MRIAVDAMGGDYAPGTVIEGLVSALSDFPTYEYALVGDLEKVGFYLEKYGIAGDPRIHQVDARSVCEMSEHATVALRGKKDSTITVCAKLLKTKEADAMVTPGHTGATVAATKVLVRTLPGVDRSGLAANMPGRDTRFLVMDAGANPDSTVLNLAQFAIMGEIYAQYLFKKERPAVGLMSVGGEDIKGNELTKTAFHIMEKLPINFVGNVEANAAYEGGVDVVICDGFVGNVFLKSAEGLALSMRHWLKQMLTKNAVRATGALLAQSAFAELKKLGSSDTVGGAPLLGLNGICIIGHGGSTPLAVRNAIRIAGDCVEFGLNNKIVEKINAAGLAHGVFPDDGKDAAQ